MSEHRDTYARARKLLTTFELFEAGVEMMRTTLRRKNPDLSDEEIGKLLTSWLHHRPGAEQGDAVGRPQTWPREAQAS